MMTPDEHKAIQDQLLMRYQASMLRRDHCRAMKGGWRRRVEYAKGTAEALRLRRDSSRYDQQSLRELRHRVGLPGYRWSDVWLSPLAIIVGGLPFVTTPDKTWRWLEYGLFSGCALMQAWRIRDLLNGPIPVPLGMIVVNEENE